MFNYANQGAQRQAAEFGDVEVIYRGPDHGDALKQQEVLESFISQKVDGIAISVLNPEFLTATIDKAVAAGIPVVTWDSDAPASKRFAYYGVDDFKSGQEMGRQAAELLGGKGTVAFLTAWAPTTWARRLDGVKDVLAAHPGIKVVETYDCQEDSVRASQTHRRRHESLSGPRRLDLRRRLARVHAERAGAGAGHHQGHFVRHESAGPRPYQGRQGPGAHRPEVLRAGAARP